MGVTKGASISRIGRQPIPIPPGVKVQIGEKEVFVQGPIGSIRSSLPPLVFVAQEGQSLVVKPVEQAGKDGARYQGLARALLKNAIEGVTTGFQKQLDLVGTGYRAEVKGKQLTLSVGYSHPILYTLPDGVDAKVEIIDIGGTKRPRLHLRSVDKELLGQTAYRIRSFRPPEPYKGKGIRFVDEKIREKAGKARKAGGKK
ncbi:MAG: 50S ribosomal protein L6 [Sandaracinaceae bacterium]|nr:50S ribosomal protein L6 [Sandaracinaceae bacterium]